MMTASKRLIGAVLAGGALMATQAWAVSGQAPGERAMQARLPKSGSPLWATLRQTKIGEDAKRGMFTATFPDEVKAFVVTGEGGNFSSGGDVHEIIGPLTKLDTKGLLDFTRMTGELVKAMRAAPQPVIAAIDGVCAGAGAIIAMASGVRTKPFSLSSVAFTRTITRIVRLLFRAGLAGLAPERRTRPT